MRVAAILVAAGKGERLGGSRPKQFLDLDRGRTMIDLSLAALRASPSVGEVVVAVPTGTASHVAVPPRVTIVEGGKRRQDSVANAFARIAHDVEIVVVHDAARPFVTPQLIERTIEAARQHGAVIAAIPVADTVKQAMPDETGASHVVQATLPRDQVFLAQTPQTFRREILERAMAAAADLPATDEAMLVEQTGVPVHLVPGDPDNVKLTTAEDLARARARLAAADSRPRRVRIGAGYDLHRLVEGRALKLAGVTVPFERGLLGHSDADIVCHAVTDALLGGAGVGDIGRMFPDSDPSWKDADSLVLLARARHEVRQAGWLVGNVDVTVIAERPKLVPYLDRMRRQLAAALEIDPADVSIKGKTNEQMDSVGRGDAMACHAVVLLISA
ncbi:MAG: 2-C-methyl-D-erythritol 4-phosphate cytidylyltransferase [Acidobacteriota bacterium]